MSLVDTVLNISSAMQAMLDFMAEDENLGNDFEEFLKKYSIEIVNQNQLTKIMLFYVFDCRMADGKRVLEYIQTKNIADNKTVEAFKNSYTSVFKINKIAESMLFVESIVNEKTYELITLTKTSSMREIGLKDYIEARIIKIDDNYFVLNIDEVISSNNYLRALSLGVNYLVKNPKNIYWDNEAKYKEFEEIVDIMTKSFVKCTGQKCTITTSKLADGLLEYFNFYHHNMLKDGQKLENYISDKYDYKYFDINELKSNSSINDLAFDNMAGGFSVHNANYSVGFWVDDDLGIFIIPNLAIFFEIFKVQDCDLRNQIEGWRECIQEFLTLDKIPVSVLEYAFSLNKHSLQVVNEAMYENFKTIEEIIKYYKPEYNELKRFSPTLVLYNSGLFGKILDELDRLDAIESLPKDVGRNDPCPCGSGKKYKNCCLNK